MAKNYCPDSLRYVVCKFLEKLVNKRFVNDLENGDLFVWFSIRFRSSRSTVDVLTVVSFRTAQAIDRCGAIRAAALDVSQAFDRVWLAIFFTDWSFMEFQVGCLPLFSNSNRLVMLILSRVEWTSDLSKQLELPSDIESKNVGTTELF